MSSGTRSNVASVGALLRSDAAPGLVHEGGGPAGGMSARQAELNRLWAFYRCMNYEGRKIDWDGRDHVGHIEQESIATAGFIPPGFYDAGGAMMPLKYRRPSAPYHLAKVIVSRFNGLLFGSKRHPKIAVPDDELTEDWLNGFVESTRLWSRMVLARTYGGAMGSVAMSFGFRHGRPKVEVHDPRWCFPEFSDREEMIVEKMEKRYQYPDTIRDPETGQMVEGWFWYRRVIDAEKDVLWGRVPVMDGEEPRWNQYRSITTTHNYGFCPVVWVQNNEMQDDVDGDPDCHGTYEMIETIDALISQANRGILSNCDPTLHISTDDDIPDGLRKGSDNAIKTSNGGSVSYLEISGAGPKAALEFADDLERRVLRITRCVLDDNFAGPARTEKEVDKNYSNMIEQADLLREQYGERGVKRLLEMVLKAARKLSAPTIDKDGETPRIVRSVIKLPKRKEDGAEREVGKGEMIELDWPDWYDASLDQIGKAVDAAGKAINYQMLDLDHAVRFIAHYFNVEDVSALTAKLEEAQAAASGATDAAYSTEVAAPEEAAAPVEGEAAAPVEELPYDMGAVAQAEALNGAQVAALIEILEKVYAGTLPTIAAEEVIVGAYPQISYDSVIRMLSEAPEVKPVTDTSPETGEEEAPTEPLAEEAAPEEA